MLKHHQLWCDGFHLKDFWNSRNVKTRMKNAPRCRADTLQVKPATHLYMKQGRGRDTKSHVTKELCFSHVDLTILGIQPEGRQRWYHLQKSIGKSPTHMKRNHSHADTMHADQHCGKTQSHVDKRLNVFHWALMYHNRLFQHKVIPRHHTNFQ